MQTNPINLDKKFRPEIEGLRVIAALLVAIYHIWFGKVSGGVDVFFVVSGFLITTSIISKYNKTGSFKFIPYITGLIKRLFPSVITVLLVTVILSFFLLPESILGKTIKEIIASLFYYQNWQLALSSTDYLNKDQMKTPVEHFWAMSIQGQFYIIWFVIFSLIFMLYKKYTNLKIINVINLCLGTLFIVSLSYSIYLTHVNQPWAYFHTFTRVWEFSLGGLLAINLNKIKINHIVASLIGWLGLIGLILTGIIFNVSTMFPGFIALWPMLCAVFILVSGNYETKYGVKKFLGSSIMVKVGGLSFGLYLWHWVILSFYQYHNNERPGIVLGICMILLSWLLSYLMTRYIEKPIRSASSNKIAFKKLGIGLAIQLLAIAFLYFVIFNNPFEKEKVALSENYPGAMAVEKHVKVKEDVEAIPEFSKIRNESPDSTRDKVHQKIGESKVLVGEYGKKENYDKTIALVGSSHAQHWLGALQKAAEEGNYRVLSMTKSGCVLTTKDSDRDCTNWNKNLIKELDKQDVDLVVTTADSSTDVNGQIDPLQLKQYQNITNTKTPIMAIRDNPRYEFNVPETLDKFGEQETIQKMNAKQRLPKESKWDQLEQKPANTKYVDYTSYFKENGKFAPVIGNVIVYMDKGHISNNYSKTFGPKIKKDIEQYFKELNH
ncbi:acyltransferase family protein [Mammaliicoccus sciuri]|uniref:acyltransferase family protein n=1 Tax=Mammaliicoccus sciuri TaxID=1296 RepID=UPI0018CBB87B|nr:acyltransferase family protein [Mammaliicoccus sciuri]MBG9209629.1 acyltransferase [Mammaliicoccus sciuri]MDT0745280.1 acyltransferase family protein [Mammaliicoccus sciuri]MDT0751477.1 acyltransferase family protein [Mammaliicoccus sciuri]WQL32419.1 acyltransferase family protein [Mammaliicoccus sciuri]WQL59357.1 acyltransferase family protein [Mammaliicoccus sciuri]